VAISAGLDQVNQFVEGVGVPVVEARRAWSDEWQVLPYVYCSTLRRGVGTQIDQATLQYESGLMQRGALDPDVEAVKNLDRWFVRITCVMNSPGGDLLDSSAAAILDSSGNPIAGGTTLRWYGVVVSTATRALGQANDDGIEDGTGSKIVDSLGADIVGAVSAANQEFFAYGLEWLLTRVWINRSVIDDGAGGTKEIGRVLPFNAGTKQSLTASSVIRGNKATGSDVFAADANIATAAKWNADDIARYLLTNFTPSSDPAFVLHSTASDFLEWWEPNELTVGPTLYDAIGQLAPTRRGLTWSVRVNDAETLVEVHAHSFSELDVSLVGGATIRANTNLKYLDDAQLRDITSLQVRDTSRVFEQVIVYGARRASCCTLTNADDLLTAGWTSTQESAYINAASAVTPVREQKKQADTFRLSDAMSPVFQRFVAASNWDGYVDSSTPVCPGLDGSGNPTLGPITMWVPGLRIANWIPLREAYDYSSSASSPTNNNPAGFVAGMRRPFVVYLLPDSTYVRGDRAAGVVRDEKSGQNGMTFTSSLVPLDDVCGVQVNPSGPAHVHARDYIATGHDEAAFDLTTDHARELDWQQMKVTAMIEFDERVQGSYPSVPGTGTNGITSILEIDVGDRARLDYLVAGTTLDVDEDGTLVTAAAAGFVRDDREWLKRVANVAWLWYRNERVGLTVQARQLAGGLNPGDFLTTYNGRDVNAMVTYVTHEFEAANTTINTDFAEIDPVGMVA